MKIRLHYIALVSFVILLTGCVTSPFTTYDSDQFTKKGLERRFGKLRESDINAKRSDGILGYYTENEYGIWETAYLQVSPNGKKLRLDFVNLHHKEGTTLSEWISSVEALFRTDLDISNLSYHGGQYNGWRVGFKSSSPIIHSVFCWIEPVGGLKDRIDLNAKVTWNWGRVLYAPYHEAKEKERLAKQEARDYDELPDGPTNAQP